MVLGIDFLSPALSGIQTPHLQFIRLYRFSTEGPAIVEIFDNTIRVRFAHHVYLVPSVIEQKENKKMIVVSLALKIYGYGRGNVRNT